MFTLIILVVGIIFYRSLSQRISKLESSVRSLNKGALQPVASGIQNIVMPEKVDSEVRAMPVAQPSSVSLNISEEESLFDRFTSWLKEDWPLKSGILLLIIGFGWFATYAFAHNWIGPMGRITLGIVAGALFLALGNWRIKNFLHQGGAFLVLGSTVILLTTFAAREVYDFFTPITALAIMFMSTAFVAFVSVRHNNRALALTSLVLAGIAPFLTNSPTNDYVLIFTYLFVVVVGAIWITILTNRRELTTAALILFVLYSLPHLAGSTMADKGTLLIFAYAFASLFFITNISSLIKSKTEEIFPDIITAGGNGLILLAWILSASQDEWKSLIISTWMIVFLAGSYLIYKFNNKKDAFYIYAGLSVIMLITATSAELSGASLTIAYTIESLMLTLVTYFALKDLHISSRVSLLIIGPIILSIGSIASRAWLTSTFNKDFFVLFILGAVLFFLGFFFWQKGKENQNKEASDVGQAFLVIGSLYAYILIWKVLHSALEVAELATIISLVIYTLVGIAFYFYGKIKEVNLLRAYGGIILGCVIIRLFIIDIWQMELAGRIVTFFLLGTLLVSTAFIGKKQSIKEITNNNQ